MSLSHDATRGMRRKKVLLIGTLAPPPGGIAHVMHHLATHLARGHDVTVLDLFSGHLWREEEGAGYRALRTRIAHPLGALRVLLHLARRRYDVLHLHAASFTRFGHFGPLLRLLAGRQCRLLLTIHSQMSAAPTGLRRRGARYALARFDAVSVLNQAQRAALLEQFGSSLRAVDLVLNDPGGLAPRRQPADAAPDPRPLIVAAGTTHPDYGLPLLLEALGRMERPVRLTLVLYFDVQAGQKRDLIAQAQRSGLRFEVHENLPHERFLEVLAQADAYVRPTLRDGDAMTLREALALGVPSLASDCVERPVGAQTFATSSVSSLVESLEQLLEAPRDGEADYQDELPGDRPTLLDWTEQQIDLAVTG